MANISNPITKNKWMVKLNTMPVNFKRKLVNNESTSPHGMVYKIKL